MEVGGLFAVPTWHLFIRRNPGFILFIMPSLGPIACSTCPATFSIVPPSGAEPPRVLFVLLLCKRWAWWVCWFFGAARTREGRSFGPGPIIGT